MPRPRELRSSKLRDRSDADNRLLVTRQADRDGPELPRRDGTGHDGDSASGDLAATEATPDAEITVSRGVFSFPYSPLAPCGYETAPLPSSPTSG
jgi:hypothetical protein